jgi:hypothetical protein
MTKDELITKWEKEMADYSARAKSTKGEIYRVVYLSYHNAISYVLEDVKQLNEEARQAE